jgi:glycerol-3-phosphate dehydrogenase
MRDPARLDTVKRRVNAYVDPGSHGSAKPSRSTTVTVIYPRIGDRAADLSWARRIRELTLLRDTSEPVDVVVVGGGITGAGVALDAASRGLSTVLLERDDLAFGTSRWSSKLVHGGLRYLATGHVDVAWESAVERGHLMTTIAPHLVRALPQVVPVMDDMAIGSALLTRAGFLAGDALRIGARTPGTTLPPAHFIRADKVHALAPTVDVSRMRGGIMAWDGQLVDDARLVVAVARTAASFGARIITHAEATQISGTGVRVRDRGSGEEFDLAARHVIAATGVWAGELDDRVHVHPSRGTHVLLDASRLGNPRAALTIPVPEMTGRYCFLLPRPDGTVLAGITDIGVERIEDVPQPPSEDVTWILEQVSRVLEYPLVASDVLGAFTGLRPLVTLGATDQGATSDISRKHLVSRAPAGHITITGGKLTTYRRMAQDAVDEITDTPCATTSIALIGAAPDLPPRSPGFFDTDPLVMRYGAEADRVRALASSLPDPTAALTPVAHHTSVARVDIAHALLHEGARDADDVVERRLRLDAVDEDAPAARAAVEEVLDALTRAGQVPAGAR